MRIWNEWNKESFVVRTNALLVNTLILTGEVSVSICDCWQNNDHTSILGMNLAVKKQEELAARRGRGEGGKHLRTLIQPCPSYEGYIPAVFMREWQKSDPFPLHHFWPSARKMCASLQLLSNCPYTLFLLCSFFSFPNFFLPKWYFFSSAGVVTVQ